MLLHAKDRELAKLAQVEGKPVAGNGEVVGLYNLLVIYLYDPQQ
jgi:hypothetical protein